jgi:hypothetical protein
MPEETEQPQVHTCPRCQFDLNKGFPEPSDEERKEYIRCLLGGNQFTKAYELFGGELKLAFSNIQTTAAEKMGAILRSIDVGEDMSALMAAVARVKLVYYLRTMNTQEYSVPDVDTLEEVQVLFDERFGRLSEDHTSILVRASGEFNNLLTVLVQSGFDENFWKGAGLI